MVGGAQLTEYDVTLDLAQLVKQPGMTGEQILAADEGLQFLQQEGYTATSDADRCGRGRVHPPRRTPCGASPTAVR